MFAEDLSPFFNPAEFAEAGLLDGVPVNGIYQRGYDERFGISGYEATFTAPSAQLAAATTASVLVVAGLTFRVRSVQPDGTGVSTLLLESQA